ncbi:MAG: D-sedoheptulose 7-phosphate isomerase [Desulfovibrionaceae bacterium]|nr:D-sedoheptulose 7-phosphate isomerase [Desulfovibrionaceae bacterium]MBF0512921.1 D-sedoheptulose 7-phosphate isomerase [Desulfovibrionaceae bacterium]
MTQSAAALISAHAAEGAQLREVFFRTNAALVAEAARTLAARLAKGGKILLCGNGGSAADAQHIAAEFVNRFLMERPPLPALALTTDTSALTAIGNDYGFEKIFAKQVQALGVAGDALVAISTSGTSPNVIEALKTARDKGLVTVGLTGQAGDMAPLCDYLFCVPSAATPLIQEVHIALGHIVCRLVDYYLFEAVAELAPYLETP